MAQHEFISRFSPNRTAPAVLEQIFVQRRDLLDQSVAMLRESALTDNKHHLLFVGPRGCGKTHLLALIVHRLEQQTDLADRLRIAWLNEDETSISFLDLLVRIYRALSDRYPQEFPRDDLKKLYGHEREQAQSSLSQNLIARIGNRTVLVLVENLDALFNQLDVSDQRTWRAFVQNHPVFATAATAQSLFAGVSEREQTFFGFFDTRHLRPLTVEEATELLQRIARLHSDSSLTEFLSSSRGRARVHAIHHLSGGNNRLYIVLSDFLTQETLDALVRPLEEMVDERLTPYYQERLRWLSPLQRKIVEFLCFRPRPVAVKEIAERLFAEHGTITSQLKKLREMGYVTSNPRGRESLYELAEPLMRLSMQVKDTRDHQPLELIVDFLRVWYEREELEDRLAGIAPASLGREYLAAALAKLQSDEPDLRRQLLRQGLQNVDVQHCDTAQIADLKALAEETGEPGDWLNYAIACYHRKDLPEAIEAFDKAARLPDASVEWVAVALGGRGLALRNAGHTEEAITDFTRAIELPGAPALQVAWGLVNRGITFDQANRLEEAIADFTRAIELAGAPANEVAQALVKRGFAFTRTRRSDEAVGDFTRAIELPGAPTEQVAQALVYRGFTSQQAGRTEGSLADFTRAIELPRAPADQVAWAFAFRGATLGAAGRAEEAIADLTRVIELPGAPAYAATAARGCLAQISFKGDRWCEGAELLRGVLSEGTVVSPLIPAITDAAIMAIFSQIGSPENCQARLVEAVTTYAEHNFLPNLGDALVRHLAQLATSPLNSAGLDQWLASWEAATSQQAAMRLPLRLLGVGIAYLKTQPRDETVLLQLPKEERALVRQALGLPNEQPE